MSSSDEPHQAGITPLEIAKMGIAYFVQVIGWEAVARLVREAKPDNKNRPDNDRDR